MWRLRWHFTRQSPLQGHLTILKLQSQSVTQLNTRAKSMTTGAVPSSCRSGTAAVMTQNEQTAEGHSTLEQQSPGTHDRPAWCVVWTVWPASMWKHAEDADVNLGRQSYGGFWRGMTVPCHWGSDTQEHITKNWILSRTCSQCSSRRSGVMSSDFLAEYTRRVEALKTDSGCRDSCPEMPERTELQ